MAAGTRFLICSCVILIFTIINFGVGPAINKRVGDDFSYVDCSYFSDQLDEYKKSNPSSKALKTYEDLVTMCRRGKAMYNMEYTTFIFNIIISFICTLLGFYGLEKEMIPKTSRIGLLCGVTGFIMTFIYVILTGVTYTSTIDSSSIYKLDSDGAFAKLDNTQKKYLCLFFEEDGSLNSIYSKFSDLIKSQYNYNKKLSDSFANDPEHKNCKGSSSSIITCGLNQYLDLSVQTYTVDGESKECTKLYYQQLFKDNKNYDISARFLAALLFSIFSCIGFLILAYNSYLLSKE